MTNLIRSIRKAREQRELTQVEAAKKTGLSVNYLRLIESGYPTHVSERVARKLITKLGAPKKILSMLDGQNGRARKESARLRKARAKRAKKGSRKAA